MEQVPLPDVQAKQLRAPALGPLKVQTPRCDATRVFPYYSDQGRPPGQCKKLSSYVLNGRHLCKAHAGDYALQLLLEHSAGRATPPPPATS